LPPALLYGVSSPSLLFFFLPNLRLGLIEEGSSAMYQSLLAAPYERVRRGREQWEVQRQSLSR
jgi:hypothetical protein